MAALEALRKRKIEPVLHRYSTAYLIGGHGIEDEPPFIVPKGCVIVVPTQMGRSTTGPEVQKNINALCSLSSHVTINPLNNIKEIIRAFGSVAIFKEGDTCPGFMYILLGCSASPTCEYDYMRKGYTYSVQCPDLDQCRANFSGVMNLSTDGRECLDTITFKQYSLHYFFQMNPTPINIIFNKIVEYFGFLYGYSVYPTPQRVSQAVKELTLVNLLDDYDEFLESPICVLLRKQGVIDTGGKHLGPTIEISDSELVQMGVTPLYIDCFKAFNLIRDTTKMNISDEALQLIIKFAHKSIYLPVEKSIIHVTQEELCSKLPGVYYNFVCRFKSDISPYIYKLNENNRNHQALNYNKINLSGPGLLRKNALHKFLRERVGEAEIYRKKYIRNALYNWRCPVCGTINNATDSVCIGCGMPRATKEGGTRKRSNKRRRTRKNKHYHKKI